MPQIRIGTTTVSYVIETRMRRQYPAIQIDSDGQMRVLIPANYPLDGLEDLLLKKSRWILKHGSVPVALEVTKQFANGAEFSFLGETVRLVGEVRKEKGEPPEVQRRGSWLHVALPADRVSGQARAIQRALIEWYLIQARVLLPHRVECYTTVVGVGPSRLKISQYTSRWGFCRADGLIAFDWRIVQAPETVVDYVVIHELMHRRYPHHRPAFWQAVAAVLPDYAARKTWLHDHALALRRWTDYTV